MNSKILNIDDAIKTAKKIHAQNKKLVLVGGCFDIIHAGHIMFLKEAKKHGDFLMIILESDDYIKKTKGSNRPINTAKDRAMILANLMITDYVVNLPFIKNDSGYDEMIYKLKPDIIATTTGDPGRHHKERQSRLIGSKVVDVLNRIDNKSTTRIARLLENEL